jgi:GTP pyrophosphokinase
MITCDDGIFDGCLDIRIHDRDDLKVLIEGLKKIEGLQEVAQIM